MTAGSDEVVLEDGIPHQGNGLLPAFFLDSKGQKNGVSEAEEFPHRCKKYPNAKARCVRCLLNANGKEIDKLREAIEEDEHGTRYDDLWLLRYILSYGTAEQATRPLLEAMKWRRENKELVNNAWRGDPPELDSRMSTYLGSAIHKTSKDGFPLHITRIGCANTVKVTADLEEREILDWFFWRKEYCYGLCDRATREEGLLIKSINIIDFSNTSIFTPRDPKIEGALYLSGKESENLYPQMVAENVIFNLPYVLTFVIGLARFILPKKMFEKLVCSPTRTDSADIYTCEFVNERFDLSSLPTFLGGLCSCEGGCVPGIPNDATGPVE